MTAANRDSSGGGLRSGWTTGACAAAAAKAAWSGFLGDVFPDPVQITLPRGQQPRFALALHEKGEGWARAGIIKDAGDDPDVTHGALIIARVSPAPPGSGVSFRAGEGVGTITRPGLPLAMGEPAINPVPRRMIRQALSEAADHGGAVDGGAVDAVVEISVPGGEAMARRTLNPRLGIVGGISILGTTGIVTPYSCSAWIHSIHRGIDVARAMGLAHIAASIGATSEKMVQERYGLPEAALIDMGDFIGGTLKYLRRHPVARLSLAGGFGKMSKLAAGHLDVHSKRCRVDMAFLARLMLECGAAAELVEQTRAAPTALEVWRLAAAAGLPLADKVAAHARAVALACLKGAPVALEVLVSSREGKLIGFAGN